MNYNRDAYGQLYINRQIGHSFEIWDNAQNLIKQAVKRKKILTDYDTIEFDKKSRASGDAIHHEIYDIHPDPLRVLLCVRETEGSKYGVRTVCKNYYIIKKHGRGVSVKPAKKSIAAKASKSADCELGCAINIVEGKTKLRLNRSCANGIAYKMLAIVNNDLKSIYDGSLWIIGSKRTERAMQNHNGGLYVYETANQALSAPFPSDSKLQNSEKVIVKCHVSGNYCRYGNKLAFSHVTPVNIETII